MIVDEMISEKRLCSICGVRKHSSDFYACDLKDSTRKRNGFTELRGRCKDCIRAKKRARGSCPERSKKLSLERWGYQLSRYGITVDQYEEMLRLQNGACAICLGTQPYRKIRLAVDHCHESGRVRGLLCDRCNKALGFASDDPDRLELMAAYLREGV